MFENLTERLSRTVQQLRGKGRLTEDGISETLREVRIALLEADVALPVVQAFIGAVREKALGQEILQSLTPGQAMVKLVHDELVQIMGVQNEALDLRAQPPVTVLMAGLQGSGKTTTTAKLARLLIEREKKRVMVVSCDVYRPAAIEQLKTLAAQVGAVFQPSSVDQKPADIARQAVNEARRQMCDVLLVDTAGRLHVDEAMMAEIREVHAAVTPHETLFVVDAMTGQDAATTAAAFNSALPLTGIVLTKTDGDARGGAALSVRQITGKPIKFLGAGEKTDALQPFHPDRVASRILGMGDVLSLVEEVHRKVDHQQAEKLVNKMRKGRGFDLEDFKSQLEQMQNMGGLGGLVDKLPGMGNLPDQVKSQVDDRQTRQMIAIINSMTPHERHFPDVIRGSRKKRIALGSGTQIQAVNRLLKQHNQMQKMMKKMGKGGMARMMRKMGKLQGQLPPGKFPGGKMPF
ncbi:MAG: signal recognition particle protein [Xanthomonadales bacterium]|nr:signal recognition particle protein [Xanthomonadales bacterium]